MNDHEAFARLRDPEFDPTREVFLADAPSIGAQVNCAHTNCVSPGAVDITNDRPEHVELKVTTEQPGYLVLADSWYPGWHALVDGQPAPVYRADVLFRAVRVEPGTHTIVFEYHPQMFTLGAVVSIAALLIVLGISISYLRYG
jgi:uncharacterized membrane protein YfhO